jgi:hypothetical protein
LDVSRTLRRLSDIFATQLAELEYDTGHIESADNRFSFVRQKERAAMNKPHRRPYK